MQNISAKIKYGIAIAIFFTCTSPVFAAYVLPYPSYMPGNKLYTVSRILDGVGMWWNFGSIARTKYELHLSDKYLVEAKTLYEYSQYLLGTDALTRSNRHVETLPDLIKKAQSERKDTTELTAMIRDALGVHRALLSRVAKEVPEEFVWKPEKSASTDLSLKKLIRESITIREAIISRL